MGSRKHNRAELVKEENKTLYFAKLTNNLSSPRKTRLMADIIRGVNVDKALQILLHSPKESAVKLRKLLMSAISNWQAKNEGQRMEDSTLYVKEIFVDGGRQLKRMRPAPQGRGHKISKRSSHITIFVDRRTKLIENNSEISE